MKFETKSSVEVQEPAVIDSEMCRECIYIPPYEDNSEPRREEARKEIDFKDVQVLLFSFKNILRIDHLLGFDSLVKLQLDNNIIEKIENLGHLVALEWLDLSFNNIEKIENLDNLTRLTDLSLCNNRITTVENLDALTALNVLSLGNNGLKQIDHLCKYLRKFKNLRTLNLVGNPVQRDPSVCSEEEYKNFLLAYIDLRYLDYRLVDKADKKKAEDLYHDELKELQEFDDNREKEQQKLVERTKQQQQHREMNIAGVEDLYDAMFEDEDSTKLQVLPGIKDTIREQKDEFLKLYSLFEADMKVSFDEKMTEIRAHREAWTKSRKQTQEESITIMTAYDKQKKRLLRELSSNPAVVEGKLKELEKRADEVWTQLMDIEMLQGEVSLQLNAEFERNYMAVKNASTQKIQDFFAKMHEMESMFHSKTNENIQTQLERLAFQKGDDKEKAAAAAAKGAEVVPEERVRIDDDELDTSAKTLLLDKDTLLQLLQSTHDARISRMDAKEEELASREMDLQREYTNKNLEEEHQRNRNRINSIAQYIKSAKAEIQEALETDEGDFS